MTLKNKPSDVVPLDDHPDELAESTLQPPSKTSQGYSKEAATEAKVQAPLPTNAKAFDLHDNIDRALFFGFYNEVADILLPTLDLSCQVLYNRLFRLSYGFNRNYCTVSQPLLMEKTGLSRNTVRTSLQALTQKGWLRIVESGNRISTTYRIVLPREQSESLNIRAPDFDPQILRVKTRRSKFEGQKQRVKNRGSNFEGAEGQILGGQNLTLKTKISDKHLDLNDIPHRGSNFEGQKLTPLLYLTNRSLTLSKEGESDAQNLKPEELKTYGEQLIDKFYKRLGQRASRAKREQSLRECLTLFDDGFTPAEVDYAINWLVENHPETGAFNRVLHFIDQALKEREAMLQATADKKRGREEAKHQAQIEEQQAAEREQVVAFLETLPEASLKKLEQEAAQLVYEEHGDVKHGREILVRLKVEELIRNQYLTP